MSDVQTLLWGVFKAIHAGETFLHGLRLLFFLSLGTAWSQAFFLFLWVLGCSVTTLLTFTLPGNQFCSDLLLQSQYSVNNFCVCVCVCCCIPFAQITRWNADHMNADEKFIFLISDKNLDDSC